MSTINSDEIISILKEEIHNYDEIGKDKEVGQVVSVGDGIATIYGIDHAAYGEIVTFENGLKGMVQDIRQNSIGCILFGDDREIGEGRKYSVPGKMQVFRPEKAISDVLSTRWARRSTAKGTLRPVNTDRSNIRHRQLSTGNRLPYRLRQESFQSIPCSRSAGDSVS